MEREETLRRRREQYRARRNRETIEERESQLQARAHEGRRRSMMSSEQRQMLLQRRREARHRSCTSESVAEQPILSSNEIPSFDDPFVHSLTKNYNNTQNV